MSYYDYYESGKRAFHYTLLFNVQKILDIKGR